jgi:hypothetical protein
LGGVTDKAEYFRIWEGQPLPAIDTFRPFKCVVIIQSPPSPEWQAAVSDWLVASGCLFMMAWGEGCSSWDDSVDYANLEAWNWGEIPEHSFVMTTWHDDEPLSEVLGFARVAAHQGHVDTPICLLIDIGAETRREQMLRDYEQAWRD